MAPSRTDAWRCGALLLGAVALVLVLACGPSSVFVCANDEQCVDGREHGRCEASGYCSFPDAECSSGYRYPDAAADPFAGTCSSPDDVADATGPADGTLGSGPATSGGSDPTLADATTSVDATTMAISTDGGSTSNVDSSTTGGAAQTSASGTTGSTSGSSDESTTAPPADPYAECLDDAACMVPQASCMYDTWALPVCNPDCSGQGADDECPAPTSGDAVPVCRDIAAGDWGCVLDCTVGACPDGMVCADSTLGPFCFWA